jgi:cobalt-zinc-cadmium efflux system outer membrane protein
MLKRTDGKKGLSGRRRGWAAAVALLAGLFLATGSVRAADGLKLEDLVNEALRNSPEIKAVGAGAQAARHRIGPAQSLADPTITVGYQNYGFDRFTYGESPDAQMLVSASQQLPFPGKRGLKGEIATAEADSLQADYHSVRFKTVSKVAGLYYDLFLAYKSIDLLEDKTALLTRIEKAAAARYASGMGSQQEVVMTQTEKYMLREREEMQRQKIQSIEGMLNAALGRNTTMSLGRPEQPELRSFDYSLEAMIAIAQKNSHDIFARQRMVDAAEARVKLAKKEFYPDFTVSANYNARGGSEKDMWSLTTMINVPLYADSKQKESLHEAEAQLEAAKNELEAAKLMIASTIQDSYSMEQSAQRLMELYQNGLLPKAKQDIEASLAGYAAGKTDAVTVITRLKALIDYETLYWEQFSNREKAVIRLTTMAELHESVH